MSEQRESGPEGATEGPVDTDAVRACPSDGVTRRSVVLGTGVAGLSGVLVACGGGSGSDGALAQTSDIPVGGGKIFADEKVVVTQPKKGTFEAFSAVCTHRGCTVGSINDGIIRCPCHGSQYSIADGSVQGGPAPQPLPREEITVESGAIKLS